MTPRIRKMSEADVRARAEHARAFLSAADLVSELGEDANVTAIGNTIGSLAVLAGIAAADAVCGAVLGVRAAGQGHGEAVDLLRSTRPGQRLAPHLRRLVDGKTEAQYSAAMITEARAAELTKAAQRLVDGMEDVLRSL